MLLVDFFGGGYVSVDFAKRLRIYAGAGPLIIYGRREFEPEDSGSISIQTETESDLSVGVYGRMGLEFKLTDIFLVGVSLRGIKTSLEFNEPVGKIEIEGLQYFLNLSIKI